MLTEKSPPKHCKSRTSPRPNGLACSTIETIGPPVETSGEFKQLAARDGRTTPVGQFTEPIRYFAKMRAIKR